MLHAARVERRPPAAFVVAGELEIVALPRHPNREPSDTGPRVEPRAESPEGAVIGWARESGEAEGCPEELAALVDSGQQLRWNREPALAVLRSG